MDTNIRNTLEMWHWQTHDWMERMSSGLQPGRFRFCTEGDRVPTEGKAALFATCFAMRGAWVSGIWNDWELDRKKKCVEFLCSFQGTDGLFRDPWLAATSRPTMSEWIRAGVRMIGRRSLISELLNRQFRNTIAETRQSASILFMVGEKPTNPIQLPWDSEQKIEKYIARLDWRFPWQAGSHLSHVLVFLKMNQTLERRSNGALLESLLDQIKRSQDEKTGTWFTGKVTDAEKLNGAMKVLTAYQWTGVPVPNPKELLSFNLRQSFQPEACPILNKVFVTYQVRKSLGIEYQRKEIHQMARDALELISRFARREGGFSYHPNCCQTHYYGASITTGKPVADLHGTAMLTWATAICVELLTDGENDTCWHVANF